MRISKTAQQLFIIFLVSIGLSACGATKKKYVWKTSNGTLASPAKIKKVKSKCRYNKRINKAADQLMVALVKTTNKKHYLRKTANKKYLKKANKTIASLRGCMESKGLKKVQG